MDPTQPVSPAPSDSRFSMKYAPQGGPRKFAFGILGIVILLVVYTWISSPMVVTVTGTGEVSVPAENATLTFTVSASDASPANAATAVNARSAAIRAMLIGAGTAESDIVESPVRVVPASVISAGASGYQAVISMGAKTVHVGDLPSLVSSLYTAGASLVSQPVLSVESQEELEQQAFDGAMKDAKAQASRIALKNWKLVRKIVNVTQATSPLTSTVTSRGEITAEATQPDVFKIVKAVAVTYKMW